MGIFDFLKPKKKEEQIDINSYLLHELKERIEEKGNTVEFSTQDTAIIVNSEIEIATAIMNGNFHPSLLPLLVRTINKEYFPDGIESSLVGLGNTDEQKIKSAVENYMSSIFYPIVDSFTDSHLEEFDFKSNSTGREILWHPKMSENSFQGKWSDTNNETNLYSIVENKLKEKLYDKKLNWLKLYISRQPDGIISGECLLNNEVWEDGYYFLEDYAKTWKDKGEFLGHKQFIMFRRCDSFD
ncbi:MAG: DUF6348 family protein [Algibacter sp.]